jgi:hypothetical protein
MSGEPVCVRCGGPLRKYGPRRRGGIGACSVDCAEKLLTTTTAVLILSALARRVDAGRARAWLCLEPLSEDDLEARRGLLRHGRAA